MTKEPATERFDKLKVLDQLRKLDEQRTALLDSAKREALEKANGAIAELKSLGFNYRLVESGRESSGGRKRIRNTDPSKRHCPICDVDGHDGRAHRGQGKTKKKFTAAEVKELDLA